MIECLKHYLSHTIDMRPFYFLEDVGDISEYDRLGLLRAGSLLQGVELLDVFEDLVIISCELIISSCLFHGQGILQRNALIKLNFVDYNVSEVDCPHISITVVQAHSLKDKTDYMKQILMSQVKESGQALLKIELLLIWDWKLFLLDEKGR